MPFRGAISTSAKVGEWNGALTHHGQRRQTAGERAADDRRRVLALT
jgi:hypothetical protein